MVMAKYMDFKARSGGNIWIHMDGLVVDGIDGLSVKYRFSSTLQPQSLAAHVKKQMKAHPGEKKKKAKAKRHSLKDVA
ncbi:hypothetical protein ACLOJK_012058 [Asimina triloba]